MPVNFINQFGGLLIIMKNRIFGLVMASVLTVSAFCGCGASMTAADSDQKGAVCLKIRQMLRRTALYVRLFLSMTGSEYYRR